MKRTLKEVANFFEMAVAVDSDGSVFMHPVIPICSSSNWYNHGDDIFCIERDLVEHEGDWRESLTLPDSWSKEPPFKEGEVIWHKELNFPSIWRTEHGLDKNDYRRPTEAEWKRLKGES